MYLVEYQRIQLGRLVDKSQRFRDEDRALDLAHKLSEKNNYPVQVKDIDSQEIIYWSNPPTV